MNIEYLLVVDPFTEQTKLPKARATSRVPRLTDNCSKERPFTMHDGDIDILGQYTSNRVYCNDKTFYEIHSMFMPS